MDLYHSAKMLFCEIFSLLKFIAQFSRQPLTKNIKLMIINLKGYDHLSCDIIPNVS
jgi:hypothetical protein